MVNGHTLQRWGKGDQLTADGLNQNFLVLYEMVIEAIAQARTPDAAVVGVEMCQRGIEERLAALEALTAMHAHQRNEKQYTPLSYHASVIIMVNDLRRDVENAIARTDEAHTVLGVDRDDLHRRLLRVEQHPDAPSKEDFGTLVDDHKALALKMEAALAEIVELRHEVKILRDWMLGTDQRVNRVQYAPLAIVGELLRRIEVLEVRQIQQRIIPDGLSNSYA